MYDNASLEKPEVLIQQLEAGKAYIATVTALNKKVTFLPLLLHHQHHQQHHHHHHHHQHYHPLPNPHHTSQGASLSVHKMVETLQQPELQLVEEKIEVQVDNFCLCAEVQVDNICICAEVQVDDFCPSAEVQVDNLFLSLC